MSWNGVLAPGSVIWPLLRPGPHSRDPGSLMLLDGQVCLYPPCVVPPLNLGVFWVRPRILWMHQSHPLSPHRLSSPEDRKVLQALLKKCPPDGTVAPEMLCKPAYAVSLSALKGQKKKKNSRRLRNQQSPQMGLTVLGCWGKWYLKSGFLMVVGIYL